MVKKYTVTDEDVLLEDETTRLYRIKALKDFGDVKKGDLGGFIQGEYNLSQEGTAWVYDNAKVFWAGKVEDNAIVRDTAVVNDSRVIDSAVVEGNALVTRGSTISKSAQVSNNAIISGEALITDNAIVVGAGGNRRTVVDDGATVSGDAVVKATVKGRHTVITGDALINIFMQKNTDYLQFGTRLEPDNPSGNILSTPVDVIYTQSNDMWITNEGFYGTYEELEKVFEQRGKSKQELKKLVELSEDYSLGQVGE